jgi:hypothetical protein
LVKYGCEIILNKKWDWVSKSGPARSSKTVSAAKNLSQGFTHLETQSKKVSKFLSFKLTVFVENIQVSSGFPN